MSGCGGAGREIKLVLAGNGRAHFDPAAPNTSSLPSHDLHLFLWWVGTGVGWYRLFTQRRDVYPFYG